jgi:phage portal protein BeeE
VFIDGEPVPPSQVIRFTSPNPPFLVHASSAIRTVLALTRAAEMLAGEPMPQGYFTDREEADPLDDKEIEAMLSKWIQKRRKRGIGYIEQGLQWVATDVTNPRDSQLHELIQHAVLEIARGSGLDPEDIGVSTTSRTYQNAEQRRLDLFDLVLFPYVSAVQDRLSFDDVVPSGIVGKFDPNSFLRSDLYTRMQTFEIAERTGIFTKGEIRRKLYLPEIDEPAPDTGSNVVPLPSTRTG